MKRKEKSFIWGLLVVFIIFGSGWRAAAAASATQPPLVVAWMTDGWLQKSNSGEEDTTQCFTTCNQVGDQQICNTTC